MATMTLDDLKSMKCATITPKDAASVIGCDAQYIRTAAHENPKRLGFNTIVYGSRTRIPRLAFIQFMEGQAVET